MFDTYWNVCRREGCLAAVYYFQERNHLAWTQKHKYLVNIIYYYFRWYEFSKLGRWLNRR